MPGENCAVIGCGTCRRTKGVGIWKLPSAKNDAYKKWRDDWLNEITKTREVDREFRERIKNDNVFTCERHFEAEDIEICKSKTLVVTCGCESCRILQLFIIYILKLTYKLKYDREMLLSSTEFRCVYFLSCSLWRENDKEKTTLWRDPEAKSP